VTALGNALLPFWLVVLVVSLLGTPPDTGADATATAIFGGKGIGCGG